jgi:hypothetical protein
LDEFGSLVEELTVAVLLDSEAELKVFAAALMVTTATLPTLKLPRLQETVVVADVYVQVPCEADELVYTTCAGIMSVTVTACAIAGPAFVTFSVYVRLVPWFTGSGEAVLTMLTSACVGVATMELLLAVLLAQLGSCVAEHGMFTFAVLVIVVPEAVPAFTFTTSGKLTDAPGAMVCPAFSVQVNVPVPPTAMALHVHPVGATNACASVVFAGIVSVNVTVVTVEFVTVAGPLFVTDCVYVILLSGETGFGEPLLLTARSA